MSRRTVRNKGVRVSIRKTRGVPGRGKFVFFPGRRKLFSILTVVQTYPIPFSMITGGRIKRVPFLGRIFTYVGTFVVSERSLGRSVRIVIGMVQRIGTNHGCLVFPRKAEDGGKGRPKPFGNNDFGATAGAGYPVIPITLVSSFGTFSANSAREVAMRIRVLPPVCCRRCGSVRAARLTRRIGEQVRGMVRRGVVWGEGSFSRIKAGASSESFFYYVFYVGAGHFVYRLLNVCGRGI